MCNRCQGICIKVYKHHLLRTKVLLEKMDLKVVLVLIGVLCVTHAKSWVSHLLSKFVLFYFAVLNT